MAARRDAQARTEAAEFARRFGLSLATARLAAGVSQEALGDLAELHRTAVGQLERGERIPRTDTLVKLAAALGIETQVLLSGLTLIPPKIQQGRFERPQDQAASAHAEAA
jgi:transcriptional regulator with XRE-family HTH domain